MRVWANVAAPATWQDVAAPPCYAGRPSLLMSETPLLPMDDPAIETLRRKLAEMRTEHRDLDDVIARLIERQPFDALQVQRLKKRKLMLKDQIARIESQLLPDIIA